MLKKLQPKNHIMPILMLVAFVSPAYSTNKSLIEKLDALDAGEFDDLISKAKKCTTLRDFNCAQKALNDAKSYANTSKNERDLIFAKSALDNEVNEDKKEREKIRLAEERLRERERQREEREQLRQEREEELERERLMRPSSQPDNSPSYAQILAGALQDVNRYAAQSAQQMNNVNRMRDMAIAQKEAQANESRRQAAEARRERQAAEEERRQKREDEQIAEERRQLQIAQAAAEDRRRQAAIAQEKERDQERQQREEQARLAKIEQAPKLGGPPNKDGCWIPQRGPNACLGVSQNFVKGNLRVVYRNNCQWGVYINAENQKRDGSWDSGAEHVSSGQSWTWSTPEASGEYRYKFTGSQSAGNDWVCYGADSAMKN